jgi:hypothetical protein
MSPLVGLTSLKLVFELAAAPDASLVTVDDVHLAVDGVDVLTNGDFSGGLTGWTTSAATGPSRVVGAPRIVGTPHLSGNLSVSRSVYVAPDGGWVRITDLVTNPAPSGTVTTDAVYAFKLGVGVHGVASAVPGTATKAFSAWDIDGAVPDVAIVHGGGQPYFRGATDFTLGTGGSEDAFSLVTLSVPAGQSKAIVHFIVLGQGSTGATAGVTATTRPAAVEATAKAIVDGFASTPTYRAYMSAAEQAAIANF